MASNTPVYIYSVKTMKEEFAKGQWCYDGYSQPLNAITASYWDARCGHIVSSQEEFCREFDGFIENLQQYKPWEFVSETLSDDVCFKRICDAFGIEKIE
jgi:hypothetical protein